MTINRSRSSLLALAVLLLWATAATAEGPVFGTRPVPQQPSHGHQPPRPAQPSGQPLGPQPPSGIEASGPEFAPVEDIKIFAQPDLSTYGGGVPPNVGWWFSYDYLRWTVSVPHRIKIGDGNLANNYATGTRQFFGATGSGGSQQGVQLSTVDTGFLNNGPNNGYRYEGGYTNGDNGFFLSAFRLYDNDQRFTGANIPVSFDAPFTGPLGISLLQGFVDPNGTGFDGDMNRNGIFGRDGQFPGSGLQPGPPDFGDLVFLPVNFTSMQIFQHTEVWGAEANYLWRLRPGLHNTTCEMFIGPRYFSLDERFLVIGNGGVLANSFWNTRANNNLVGGQIGLRAAHKRGRLALSAEGRFLAAANILQLKQEGEIASANIPGASATVNGNSLDLQPTGFYRASRPTMWAPLGEVRLELAYQVFNKVSLSVGWTGIIADGVARPSNLNIYRLPDMGLKTDNIRQSLFLQGLTLGVELNR